MEGLSNSIITYQFLKTLVKVIGRRSSEQFSIYTLDSIVYKLREKYDFLKYVKINREIYKETLDFIIVDEKLNKISKERIGKAVDNIFDNVIRSLTDNIGYFFIKEIQEDLEREVGPIFSELEISYYAKQQLYEDVLKEIERMKLQGISNIEIFEIILKSLINIAHVREIENFNEELLIQTMKKLTKKYKFLKYIIIREHSKVKGHFIVRIKPIFNDYTNIQRGKIIEEILLELGRSAGINVRRKLIEVLKMRLTPKEREKIITIGVNLENISVRLSKEDFEIITLKIFETLFQLINKEKSNEDTLEFLNYILQETNQEYKILKLISIDKTKLDEGFDAISIDTRINKVQTRALGKSIRELLFKIQDNQNIYNPLDFFNEFKNYIGKDFIKDMDKIGVNTNLLEIRAH